MGRGVEWDLEDFKRIFPNLYREMLQRQIVARKMARFSRPDADEPRELRSEPSDYLRRCRDPMEALEVIAYLERVGEISHEEAEKLKDQLEREGLRSFGPFKEDDYYVKRYLGRKRAVRY